jgi:hypothetical protein
VHRALGVKPESYGKTNALGNGEAVREDHRGPAADAEFAFDAVAVGVAA